jgi:hypothetical protein
MGGIVSIALGPHTTHVAGAALPHLLSPAAAAAEQRAPAPAVEPEALLRAVAEQAGGAPAVSALKLGLATGNMRLVSDRWGELPLMLDIWMSLGAGRQAGRQAGREGAQQHVLSLANTNACCMLCAVSPCCRWVHHCMEEAERRAVLKPPSDHGGSFLLPAAGWWHSAAAAADCGCISCLMRHGADGLPGCACPSAIALRRLCFGCGRPG